MADSELDVRALRKPDKHPGPDGLRYLTVHQRRKALTLTTAPATRGE